MSTALRLNDDLVQDAQAEASIFKRTTPKQIEYWAEIGRVVSRHMNPGDLLSLMQGVARLQVEPVSSHLPEPEDIFADVDCDRTNDCVSRSSVYYEASLLQPGLLDRVQADGSRETGYFRDGQFIAVT